MKPGTRLHKGIEVPINAIIHISELNREYYLSGIHENVAIIKFLDNHELLRITLNKAKMLKLVK